MVITSPPNGELDVRSTCLASKMSVWLAFTGPEAVVDPGKKKLPHVHLIDDLARYWAGGIPGDLRARKVKITRKQSPGVTLGARWGDFPEKVPALAGVTIRSWDAHRRYARP